MKKELTLLIIAILFSFGAVYCQEVWTINRSPEDTIYYDDGWAFFYNDVDIGYWAQRFTPSEVCEVTGALVMTYMSGTPCTLFVWDDDGGLPGEVVAGPYAFIGSGGIQEWVHIDITSGYIEDDDFWIGIYAPCPPYMCFDMVMDAYRTYLSYNGIDWSPFLYYGDVMIRALVEYGIMVSVPDTSASPGDTINIPINISNVVSSDSIYSADFTLTYNPQLLSATGVIIDNTTLPWWVNWSAEWDTTSGEIHVILSGSDVLEGEGILAYINFIVGEPQTTSSCPLHFNNFIFNDGTPEALTIDGIFTCLVIGVEESSNSMISYLSQNTPNPFSEITSIQYSVTKPSHVIIKVYDIKGRLVNILIDNRKTQGNYSVDWNGLDKDGRELASGVYLYRLSASGRETDTYTEMKKLIILR